MRTRARNARGARADAPALVGASELAPLLDEVKATAIALLAALQEKERTLRDRAQAAPAPGIERGLSDILALRLWADKTLRTIGVLEKGRSGELSTLLEELGEFGDIVRGQ